MTQDLGAPPAAKLAEPVAPAAPLVGGGILAAGLGVVVYGAGVGLGLEVVTGVGAVTLGVAPFLFLGGVYRLVCHVDRWAQRQR